MTEESHILQLAAKQFTAYGIALVSVDAIARLAGISKTKLYGYYPSKEMMVEAVMQLLLKKWYRQIEQMNNRDLNPIQKLYGHYHNITRELLQVNPIFLHDLQKYYQSHFEEYSSIKTYFVFEVAQKLLDEAREEGMLLACVNPEQLCKHYFFNIVDLMHRQLLSDNNHNPYQILHTLLFPMLRGILKKEYIDSLVLEEL